MGSWLIELLEIFLNQTFFGYLLSQFLLFLTKMNKEERLILLYLIRDLC
jgi:hypothetical protein